MPSRYQPLPFVILTLTLHVCLHLEGQWCWIISQWAIDIDKLFVFSKYILIHFWKPIEQSIFHKTQPFFFHKMSFHLEGEWIQNSIIKMITSMIEWSNLFQHQYCYVTCCRRHFKVKSHFLIPIPISSSLLRGRANCTHNEGNCCISCVSMLIPITALFFRRYKV